MKETKDHLNIDLRFLDKKESVRVAQKQEIKESQIENKSNLGVTKSPQPWRRYWARGIDITVFSLVFGYFFPSITELSSTFLAMLIGFLYVFVESIFLSSWGTTPGKWLLNINIERSTGKLDFSTAINRSFMVYLKGLGLCIPVVSLFTMFFSYNYLIKNGITPWDKDGNFKVSYGKINIVHIIIVIISVIFFLFYFL